MEWLVSHYIAEEIYKMDFLALLDQMPDLEEYRQAVLEEERELERELEVEQELEEELYNKSFDAAELQQEGE